MNEAAKLSVTRDADGCVVELWVHEPDMVGKQAVLKVEQHARVKRSSPVHKHEVLAERRFTVTAGQNRLALGEVLGNAFTYSGSKLDLHIKARIEIDDGVIFDTKLEIDLSSACVLPPRNKVPTEHSTVHSPRDRFSFIANLRAIPPKARLVVLWLMLIGIPVVVANGLLGARDQFVPESQVWFYDHSGSDGDSESPLMKALMGSGAAGMGLWLAIRRQLQKYMSFEARLPHGAVKRGGRCRASDMIEGAAMVPLQQATVRIVAYNREHGQYTATEKNGKSSRTVTKSFTENARGVVLYEQLLAYVPAKMPLAGYLDGEVDFSPVFDALYPPFMLGSSHGLSLQLEAQLIHPEFVDHDIELDPGKVDPGDFYRRDA